MHVGPARNAGTRTRPPDARGVTENHCHNASCLTEPDTTLNRLDVSQPDVRRDGWWV
jgi:hypothetical protein